MASKWKDIGEGIVGAVTIAFALLTPCLRSRRVRWGSTDAEVQRTLPGDDLVPHPKWQYTNANFSTLRLGIACDFIPKCLVIQWRLLSRAVLLSSTPIRVPDLHLFLAARSRRTIIPAPGCSSLIGSMNEEHGLSPGFGVTITQE